MNIHIPTPLRSYTGGLQTVSIAGDTVGAALDQITARIPS